MGEPHSETTSVFPAGLLERVRKINNIYKQTVKILPVNIGNVTNGNKILLQMPTDSVFDLKSLSFDATIHVIMVINQEMLLIIILKHTIYLVMELQV